jgi:uncharacterized membrane protein
MPDSECTLTPSSSSEQRKTLETAEDECSRIEAVADSPTIIAPPPAFEDIEIKSMGSNTTMELAEESHPESHRSHLQLYPRPSLEEEPSPETQQNQTQKVRNGKGSFNLGFDGCLDEKNKNFANGAAKHINGHPSRADSLSSSQTSQGKKDKGDKEYTGFKRFVGMLLTLLASLSFSIVVLFVKILNGYGFDGFGASFWRYAGTTIPTIPLLIIAECRMRQKKEYDTEKLGECKASSKSVINAVWPLNVNENWKQWIGLLVRKIM